MTAAPPESQTERRRVGSSHRRQQQRANPSPRVYPPQPLPLNGAEYSAHVDDVRASQIIRGSLRTKIVASPEALRSLESVSVSELPENEKVCVICYNEFGAESPEGIREAPLRLPNCKHVFGDHCIKKWFEDSDSCPYCRDKLPSETRVVAPPNSIGAAYLRGLVGAHGRSGSSARVHHTGGGSRPGPLHSMGNAASSGSQQQAQERRSPPWDGEQSHRRQRPRHGTSEPARHEPQWASDQGGGPSTSAEAATSLRAAPEQAVGRGMVGGRRQAGTGPSGPSATQGSGDLGSSVADAGGGYRPYSATGGRMNNNGEAQVATARDGPEGLANFMTFHDSGQARLVEPATHWVPPPSWFQ